MFYFRTRQQAVYGLTAAAARPRMVAQRLAFGVQVANLQVRILFCEMYRTRFAQNGASPNMEGIAAGAIENPGVLVMLVKKRILLGERLRGRGCSALQAFCRHSGFCSEMCGFCSEMCVACGAMCSTPHVPTLPRTTTPHTTR